MKLRTLALCALLTTGLLSGCSYEPFEGTVTGKEESIDLLPTGKVLVPQDDYDLSVLSADGVTTDSWDVKKSVYEACSKGDAVKRTEDGTVTCTEGPANAR